jgi:serine/threonine-protein kinase
VHFVANTEDVSMLVGQQLGPFLIDKEIGSGAMGAVYRASYVKTGQRVAVKVMAPGLGSGERLQARFERESEILKQLNHPNIVRLFGIGKSHGTRYYAMEFIKGESLDKVIQRRGRVTWEEVVVIGQQLCAALQHAHEHGIIHRDLKPSNIMVLADGAVKLTDFGIAKDLDVTQLTASHNTVGTAAYMSPEQCRGERELSHKSDLYSLGIVFYELLTGKKPFQAEAPLEMFMLHLEGKVERPSRQVLDIPVWLDTLVCQLLEKKPEQRPRDAAAVADALERIADKVAAQQSAGVDAVKARAIDRLPGGKPDETDREAARTLHQAVTGKRLKRRGTPIYRRGWFIAVGAVALLAGMGVAIYWAVKPPPPETLYQQAERLMASTEQEDWDRAREGPIKEYLRHYGRRKDERTAQVKAWADQVDLRLRERQLANRMRQKLSPQDDRERAAQAAAGLEEKGDLDAARKEWQGLLQYKEYADFDAHAWGLLAEKRLREVNEVAERLHQWSAAVDQGRQTLKEYQAKDELDRLAARAIHYEQFGDLPAAFGVWSEVKAKCAQDSVADRFWSLLNAYNAHRHKGVSPPYSGNEGQLEFVNKRLDDAKKLEPRPARVLYHDVVTLYHNAKHLAKPVEEARKLLGQ